MSSKSWQYPLFQHWYKATDWLMDKTAMLPRSVRPTLVKRMDDYALDILELIQEAIFSQAKVRRTKLRAINLKLDKLRILIRLCHDRQYISTKQYQHAAELLDETGRMVGGWLKIL
ncbi:MAG: diversity-generating retroelement protein Avd [Bacteroidota bacterium]